jgi:alpha-L-fucosidase
MLCLDMWFGAHIWPRVKETVKAVRKIQPDVMMRCRGIGNYGDYYTPENFLPGKPENTDMPWMVIYGLGNSFSYEPEAENYKGAGWIIQNLASAVSKGGAFMVGIGPDGTGAFHPEAVKQLLETGKWLAIHGEAIYGSSIYDKKHCEEKHGDNTTYLTCSPDRDRVYAISTGTEAHNIIVSLDRSEFGAVELPTPLGIKSIPETDIIKLDGMFVIPKKTVLNLSGVYNHAATVRLCKK